MLTSFFAQWCPPKLAAVVVSTTLAVGGGTAAHALRPGAEPAAVELSEPAPERPRERLASLASCQTIFEAVTLSEYVLSNMRRWPVPHVPEPILQHENLPRLLSRIIDGLHEADRRRCAFEACQDIPERSNEFMDNFSRYTHLCDHVIPDLWRFRCALTAQIHHQLELLVTTDPQTAEVIEEPLRQCHQRVMAVLAPSPLVQILMGQGWAFCPQPLRTLPGLDFNTVEDNLMPKVERLASLRDHDQDTFEVLDLERDLVHGVSLLEGLMLAQVCTRLSRHGPAMQESEPAA